MVKYCRNYWIRVFVGFIFSKCERILLSVEIIKFCFVRLVIWISVVGVVYFYGYYFLFYFSLFK